MYTINFWPILVASIVAFGISSLWYSPILFGKEWMALTKTSESDVARVQAQGIWKLYVLQLLTTIVSFSILAFLISSTQTPGGTNGAFIGFLIWFGFILVEAIGMIMWEKRPFKLVLIQSVSILINLVIGGAIIGAWR